MLNKKMIFSVIMAGMLAVGGFAAPLASIDTPLSITASAATTSQTQQLQADMQTITSHITRISYLSYYKKTNTKNVVMAFQRSLNTLDNAGLVVDGIYGNACTQAAKNFQRKNGLTVDGMFGTGSLRTLQTKANVYIAANTPKTATVNFGSMISPSTLAHGSSFNLVGTITSSGAPISSFSGEILSGSSVIMAKTVYPNAYSVNIGSSAVNYGLTFGKLNAGSYTLKYTVTAGNTTKTYTQAFTVQPKKATISFNSMTAPNRINQGKSFALAGSITTTNQPIYSITAKIVNSANSAVISKTVYPNSYKYSIGGSQLDRAMKFASLSAGQHTLIYNVTAADGTNTSKSYSFTVNSAASMENISSSSTNASKLVQTAKADIGKNYAQMGFPYNQAWCARSVGKWLANIGINLGDTATVNNVVERLVSRGYSSTAYVFRDTKGVFTSGNLYNLYGSSKVQRIENRNNIKPQPGDVICWKWGGSKNCNYDHIGIVVSYNPSTKKITTLEGNAGAGSVLTRKVCYCERDFDSTVVALVRLK